MLIVFYKIKYFKNLLLNIISRAIESMGYKITRSYIYKDLYKTNAP